MNRVEFDLAIYSETALLKAIADYKEICTIRFNKADGYMICKFSDCRYELSVTINEFSNYVIDLMNMNDYVDH